MQPSSSRPCGDRVVEPRVTSPVNKEPIAGEWLEPCEEPHQSADARCAMTDRRRHPLGLPVLHSLVSDEREVDALEASLDETARL